MRTVAGLTDRLTASGKQYAQFGPTNTQWCFGSNAIADRALYA